MSHVYTAMNFGGKPLRDPRVVYDECVRHGFPTDSFDGLANSYTCPVGTKPGKAWLLMARKDIDALDMDAGHTLRMEVKAPGSDRVWIDFDGLYPISAKCVLPGQPSDPEAAYLVECEDERCKLRNFQTPRSHYNIRSHGTNNSPGTMWTGPDDIYTLDYDGINYYSNTVDLASTWGGGPYNVNGVLGDVAMSLPTAITGFTTGTTYFAPYPSGLDDDGFPVPQNIILPTSNSIDALQWLLDLFGTEMTYSPTAARTGDKFSFVRKVAREPGSGYVAGTINNTYPLPAGVPIRYPKKVVVNFRRFRDGWGLDYDTQMELTKPHWSVEADTEDVFAALEINEADLDDDSVAVLYGCMEMANFNEFDVLQNAADLQIAADRLAEMYYKQLGKPTVCREQQFVYTHYGISLATTNGPVLYSRVTWGDTGDGLKTEVYHRNEPTVGGYVTREEGMRFPVDRKIVKITGQPNAVSCVYPAAVYTINAFTEASGESVTLTATGETLYVGNFRQNKLVQNQYYWAYKHYVNANQRTFRWVVDNQATFI